MTAPDNPAVPQADTGAVHRLEAFPAGSSGSIDWGEVLDSINDAILVHDTTTGTILHANAVACQMFGYSASTLPGRTIGELSDGAPPYTDADARRWLARALTEGPQLLEWLARAADGRRFWVEVAIRAGRTAGVTRGFVTVRDITARKALAEERERAHAALRQSEERFRLLLGRMPNIALQGCGPDGAVRYWNEASERLYGYSAAEAIGRPLVALLAPPSLRDEMRITLHQMLATGRALPPAEVRLQRKDGTLVTVFSSHTVVQVPGAGPELYRLDFDLSERKQAEHERLELERRLLHSQKLESLGVLTGGIAHDFNNLLTGVLGNLELARAEMSVSDRSIPLVDDAILAARLAANLTHQMLAYTGRTQFQVQSLDLNTVVHNQATLLHAAVAGRATLELALAPELPAIEADAGQLGQILVNLVTNAAEAVNRPGGTVEVRTSRLDLCSAEQLAASLTPERPAPQPFVCLEVADTGCGMDTATVQRVFDPFFSTKFAGRGLGLPVVQGIVRAHHGALFIDSQPGRGSVVTVLLPLARPRPAADAPAPVSGGAAVPAPGLLLVVDDEEAVRRIALRMGQRLGYEVIVAPDGGTAVDCCRQHAASVRLALIDLTMPDMDGFECLRALREVRPGLPALLSSGCAEATLTERIGPAGFAGFLQKPFSFDQFTAALRVLAAAASG